MNTKKFQFNQLQVSIFMFHLNLGKGFLYNPFGENQLMEKKAAIKIFHSNLKQSLTHLHVKYAFIESISIYHTRTGMSEIIHSQISPGICRQTIRSRCQLSRGSAH